MPESSASETEVPVTGSVAKLFNIYATPTDVYAEVRDTKPAVSLWLLPTLLLCVVGIVFAMVVFSQPTVLQQIKEQQDTAITKKVQAGKLTQAQADQARQAIETFSTGKLTMIFGAVGAVIGSGLKLLWWASVVWCLGRWVLKSGIGYPKAFELVGLALMISVLGSVVTTLLVVSMGSMYATPSLAVLIKDFDPANAGHAICGALNLFHLWTMAVISLGLAVVCRASLAKALAGVFGVWVVFTATVILLGMGSLAL